jgi:hypothetical protein
MAPRGHSFLDQVEGAACQDALAHLHRFSLVSVDPSGRARAIRTHAMVPRATLEHRPPEVISAAVRAAADALMQAWPEVERNTELDRALRENTAQLSERYPQPLWESQCHPVLFRAGGSLGECGLVRTCQASESQPSTARTPSPIGKT